MDIEQSQFRILKVSQILSEPTKSVTTSSIFMDIGQPQHSTILGLLSIDEGTLDEISAESGDSIEKTKSNLEALENSGFVGKKMIDSKIVFYYVT